MLRPLGIAVLAALAGTALAQNTERPEWWASSVCDLMTPQEMRLCLATRPGDVSGIRSSRCDEIAQHQMEMCLQQSQGNASAGATSDQTRRETSGENKESRISAPSPQKKE